MDRGDRQLYHGHGQEHSQGQDEGQVQSGFDTFVMTGDMIIKTTPKLAAPSSRQKTGKPSSPDVHVADYNTSDNILSPDPQQLSYNGGMEVPSQVAGSSRFPDVPVELDIPPDDISSEDERYRMDCLEDLDITNLPPPPAEFFGDSPDPCLPTSMLSGFAVRPVTDLPGCDGEPEKWRNSLDEAIMRLESQTASGDTWIGPEFPSQHGPAEYTTGNSMGSGTEKGSSAGRADLLGSLVSAGAGVRPSKSQENWQQCGGSGVGLVNIDVDGSSTSVEALHHVPLTSLDHLDPLLVQNRPNEAPLLHNSADDVRHRYIGACSNSNLLSSSGTKEKNFVNSAEKRTEHNINSGDTMEGFPVEPPPDYRDGASPEHLLFTGLEELRPSPGQRLLGGGKNSPVRQLPPFQNGTDTESNHHIPACWNNVSDTSRSQLKDVDHPSAGRLAKRLYHLDGFRKSDVCKHLSKKCANCVFSPE